jgi:hypothetical protein
MPLNNPWPGGNLLAEYQISGVPWLSSSTIPAGNIRRVDFDRVTQFITVRNDATGTMRLAFTQAGLTSNYWQLAANESVSERFRCTVLFLSGAVGAAYSIRAGMTNIGARHFPVLTGSVSGSLAIDGLG